MEPREILAAEYLARREKNPAYSLRAFSNFLEIPSGRVSQLLSEKRPFTRKLGEKIASRLNYDPEKKQKFLDGIESVRRGMPVKASELRPVDLDLFQSIADPIHFAILSLMETRDFREAEISSRLGISPVEAREAVGRLLRVGLLKREKGKLELSQAPGLSTPNDIASPALRESHKRIFAHSVACLEEVAVELRDITSITMAIDPARLPEAKTRLREMRRSLMEFLEGGKKEEVYRLNVQLVPVSKRKPRKGKQ